MRKLLLQLDSSRLPSVFDQVVAYDAGADEIMSYGGVTETDVRDLIHGCIFTRGPKDLQNTAVWIGGSNMSAGEQLLAMAQDAVFTPLTVSIMLDSNGSNTTAVAAVVEDRGDAGRPGRQEGGDPGRHRPGGPARGRTPGPDGANVTITSRKPEQGDKARQFISARFNVQVDATTLTDPSKLPELCKDVEVLLNSGPAGVQMVPKSAWTGAKNLKIAVDLNAVPPLGIEGIEVTRRRRGQARASLVYGAFGVGNFKTKLHKACVARLFTRNDLVLDAETIAEVARELIGEELGAMPRVVGIDAGTVSLDVCGLVEGRLSLDLTWPTQEAVADPRWLHRRAAPPGRARPDRRALGLWLAAAPGAAESPRRSCGSRSSRGPGERGGIGGLRRLARQLADSDLPRGAHARAWSTSIRSPSIASSTGSTWARPTRCAPPRWRSRTSGSGPAGRWRRSHSCCWSSAEPSPRPSRWTGDRSWTDWAAPADRSAGRPPARSTARWPISPAGSTRGCSSEAAPRRSRGRVARGPGAGDQGLCGERGQGGGPAAGRRAPGGRSAGLRARRRRSRS